MGSLLKFSKVQILVDRLFKFSLASGFSVKLEDTSKTFGAIFFKYFFLVCIIWLLCIFLFFYIEPELGVGIDPGMGLTPFTSSIGLDGDRTYNSLIMSRVLYP